jgi:hypothetical protein
MRSLGLFLVFVGVGMAAAFGSQLSPRFRAQQLVLGDVAFVEALADGEHETYCERRSQAGLVALDGCGGSDLFSGVEAQRVSIDATDSLSDSEERHRELTLLSSVKEELPSAVRDARRDWLSALQATQPLLKRQRAQQRAFEKKEQVTPGAEPFDRLWGWWGQAWVGFVAGLLMLTVGSVLYRLDLSRTKETVEGGEDGALPAQDFGVVLGSLCTEARLLASVMMACEQPTEGQLAQTKSRLERLQKEQVVRLVQAGPRLQAKYGMAGFAAVFSPLSGGERLLNRTWSTLVDRHWPEAQRSIEAAATQLEGALEALNALSGSA